MESQILALLVTIFGIIFVSAGSVVALVFLLQFSNNVSRNMSSTNTASSQGIERTGNQNSS